MDLVRFLPALPDILVAVLSGLAAYRWWRSTTIEMPNQFPIYVAEAGGTFGGMPGDSDIGIGHSPELNNLANQLRGQSNWNSWAARAAAGASFVQALIAVAKIVQIAGQH